MFALKEDEEAALAELTALEEAANLARRTRDLAAIREAEAEYERLAKSPLLARAALKAELRKQFEGKLPLPPEELLSILVEEFRVRKDLIPAVVSFLQEILKPVHRQMGDPEYQRERALLTYARYEALTAVGLPVDLVHGIILAEAAQPSVLERVSSNLNKK